MGLSLVHNIVVESGGYIVAHSQPGQGNSFEILWPCMGTFQGTGLAESPTILLVEDENGRAPFNASPAGTRRLQMLAARNAEDAEEIAGVYQSDIQLLVTDVVMPGMTGPQLADRMRPRHPGMKVLYVSDIARCPGSEGPAGAGSADSGQALPVRAIPTPGADPIEGGSASLMAELLELVFRSSPTAIALLSGRISSSS
ncbi:MAG: response regulator [Ignavibacteriota bacterium]